MGFTAAASGYGFGFTESNDDLAGFICAVCGTGCVFAFSCAPSLAPRPELPRPPQPMLSIWGAADGSHPASNAHSLARLYDGVEQVTLDALGHTPELEDPAPVFAAITAFLGRT
jgi:pimeloyl-ACP methyl ester carboxylesterase